MKQLLVCTLLCATLSTFGQKVFFQSNHQFSESDLEDFYSSVAVYDSMVLFKANDYTMYAYNKHTGKEIWKYYLRYKSNTRAYVAGNYIWTNSGEVDGLRLDITGTNPKVLPFSVYSEPMVKDNMVYLTGIYEAGNVLAYDLKADSIAWYKFIAHGCEIRPYYFNDRIVANAEGNNWIELNYDGSWKKECKPPTQDDEMGENDFDEIEHCKIQFSTLLHDGQPMKDRLTEDLALTNFDRADIVFAANKTFILDDGRFTIVGKNHKKLFSKEVFELSDDIEEDNYQYSSILKTDDRATWIYYNKKLLIFNHNKNKIQKIIDLQAWQPHRLVADGNKLWLINREDGKLYGVEIEEGS